MSIDRDDVLKTASKHVADVELVVDRLYDMIDALVDRVLDAEDTIAEQARYINSLEDEVEELKKENESLSENLSAAIDDYNEAMEALKATGVVS